MTELDELEALVHELVRQPTETRTVEFKAARNQFSYDKALEYCAALANERGGHLILGVSDKPPRQFLGTEAFRNLSDFEGRVHDKLRIRIEASELNIEGARIVVIRVGSRPAGHAIDINGRYLMRQGEQLVPMSFDQIRRIAEEDAPPLLERTLRADLTAEEVDSLIDTNAFFTLSKTDVPADLTRRCQILSAQRILVIKDGKYGLQGVGAALFARDLTEFPELEPRALRFLQYQGENRVSIRREYIAPRGYALAFEPFLDLINAAIPVDERIQSAHRQTVPMYEPVALREILANAIGHQDFETTATHVNVELYESRLEVTNAGTPILEPTRFAQETKPRNHALSMLMRQLHICEARGSGIQRTLMVNEESGAADPAFNASDGITHVVLTGKRDFKRMSIEERNWAIFMHTCRRYSLNDAMTNATFRARYGLSDKASSLVSTHILQTMDSGLIRLSQPEAKSKRFASYVPYYAT